MIERGSGKIIFTASLLTFQGGITVTDTDIERDARAFHLGPEPPPTTDRDGNVLVDKGGAVNLAADQAGDADPAGAARAAPDEINVTATSSVILPHFAGRQDDHHAAPGTRRSAPWPR